MKTKDFTAEQYQELKTIAHSYGMSLGGYQTNHGYTVYTSERVVYGKTFAEVVSDLHRAGEDAKRRINRTLSHS